MLHATCGHGEHHKSGQGAGSSAPCLVVEETTSLLAEHSGRSKSGPSCSTSILKSTSDNPGHDVRDEGQKVQRERQIDYISSLFFCSLNNSTSAILSYKVQTGLHRYKYLRVCLFYARSISFFLSLFRVKEKNIQAKHCNLLGSSRFVFLFSRDNRSGCFFFFL